jgi:hypothetical protein
MLVKLNRRNGKKLRGIITKEQSIFHSVTDNESGKRRLNESAKSTMRATQAAASSSVNSTLVTRRALRPKEMKATSENVIRLGSRSMHLASSLAVQAVTAAQRNNEIIPQSQPAYLIPIGKLRRPMPIRTLRHWLSDRQVPTG